MPLPGFVVRGRLISQLLGWVGEFAELPGMRGAAEWGPPRYLLPTFLLFSLQSCCILSWDQWDVLRALSLCSPG